MATTFHIIEFEVTGSTSFPLDMLRYDACYPARQEDTLTIGMSLDYEGRGGKRVRLRKRLLDKNDQQLTEERWKSFGWEIDQKSIVRR